MAAFVFKLRFSLDKSNPNRIRLLRIDLVLLDRTGNIFRIHLAFARQCGDRCMCDVITIDFEETTQIGTCVGTSETIGTEHGVFHRDEGADLIGECTHVIGRGNRRSLAAFETFGHVGFTYFGFRMQTGPAFGVETIATQFVETRAGPDVATRTVVNGKGSSWPT